VVTRIAEDQEVFLAIVAAAQHRAPVVNLERALARRRSAELTRPAAGRDQSLAPRIGHRDGTIPQVVGEQNPVSHGTFAHERREVAWTAG
jgi:hypothetical protein